MTRGPSRPGPGEGVGEEGFLEEERKISLDHLRPEGWWDYVFFVDDFQSSFFLYACADHPPGMFPPPLLPRPSPRNLSIEIA